MRRILTSLLSRLKSEDGSSTVEFVLIFPVIFGIFMTGYDSSMYITRFSMLDRALDLSMRDLRLGRFPDPDGDGVMTHDELKDLICSRTVLIRDCGDNIRVALQRVDTATFDMPTDPMACVDRTAKIQPLTTVTPGQADELMLVRACVIIEGVFPGSAFGTRMVKEPGGGYIMTAKSVYVNEP